LQPKPHPMTQSLPPKSLVLYADDDPDDRMLIREAFEHYAHSVDLKVFRNGVELLQYVNKAQAFATYNSSFTISPQIGMLFFLKKRTYIDAGIRYETLKSFNNDNERIDFWAAHVAFAFNL